MTLVIKKFAKAPAERLYYTIDYGKKLTRLTDTIENRITTAGGRKYARRIQIAVQNAA